MDDARPLRVQPTRKDRVFVADTVNRRASIRDVAQAAGVSTGTVSRVLNNHAYVSAEVRERVRSVIAQLGYQPSPVGRALSTRTITAIGILIPDMADPVFMVIAQGIESVAKSRGYAVMLANSDREPAQELLFADLMAQFNVAGVLIVGDSRRNDHDLRRRLGAIPTVVIARRAAGNIFPAVTIDHYLAAKAATEHLIELGHRRIGAVRGDPYSDAGTYRFRGYVDAMQGHGIEPDPSLAAGGSFAMSSSVDATHHLCGRPDPPTAIFYPSDELALGGMRVIKDLGFRIPNDVSVISINDIPFATTSDPPLTTVHMPARELGTLGMQTLIDMIAGRGPARDVVLGMDLVIRHSTAPPPSTAG